jgi:hypothetical protein
VIDAETGPDRSVTPPSGISVGEREREKQIIQTRLRGVKAGNGRVGGNKGLMREEGIEWKGRVRSAG